MSNTEVEFEKVLSQDVAKIGVEAELKAMTANAKAIKVLSVDDKDGYKEAKAAKGVLVSARTGIEKRRKELKQPYLDAGKTIDAAAKHLTEIVSDGEQHLLSEMKKVEDHEAELQRKKEEERQQKLSGRKAEVTALNPTASQAGYSVGVVGISEREIEAMTDSDFSARLKMMSAERNRLDEEQARMDAHMARLKELEAREAQREAESKASIPDAVETGFDPFGPDVVSATPLQEPNMSVTKAMTLKELVAAINADIWINEAGESLADSSHWKAIIRYAEKEASQAR